MSRPTFQQTLVALAIAALPLSVFAGGTHAGDHHARSDAQSKTPGRTIQVTLNDNYFEPESIQIKAGETIVFELENQGALVHEFNIGTAESHLKHQPEMAMMMAHGVLEADRINHDKMNMKMPNGHTMDHNHANSRLLAPGEKTTMIWTFKQATNLEFACNMPGHYQSGMVGKLVVGEDITKESTEKGHQL